MIALALQLIGDKFSYYYYHYYDLISQLARQENNSKQPDPLKSRVSKQPMHAYSAQIAGYRGKTPNDDNMSNDTFN